MRYLIFAALLFSAVSVFAQRDSRLVRPADTDPAITTNLSPHYVTINRAVKPNGKLLLMLPGTRGFGAFYKEFPNAAADLGYRAVTLTYASDDAVNLVCGGLRVDLDCFGNVRLETIDGRDRTPAVNIDRPNSIENRLIKLLQYLDNREPREGWGVFLTRSGDLDWPRIVVAGHSQGGGHAGILGRYHPVARVIMFNAADWDRRSNAPATWIARPDSTPNASTPDKFYGFSHKRDNMVPFPVVSQAVWPAYGMTKFGPVVNVDAATPPYSGSHQLTTDLDCDNTHGCTVADARLTYNDGTPVYLPVWRYLLR